MPQHIFDSLVSKAREMARSLASRHNLDSNIQSSPQNVESVDNEDVSELDDLDVARNTDEILLDDYLLQMTDNEPVELEVTAPGMDVQMIWELPVCDEVVLFIPTIY